MHLRNYTLFASLAVLALAALFLIVLLHPSGESRARTLVQEFGMELKHVSLLAPDASSAIAAAYRDYVSPELLAQWEKDPLHAPGRLTSSPYPDRIEVESIGRQGRGYIVLGEVVMMTSMGESGREPVLLLLSPEGYGYKIAAYQEQRN